MPDVIKVQNILEKAIQNNRLHHAILLNGSNIDELECLAQNISKKILNSHDLSKHPDFFTLKPEGKSRFIKIGSDSDKVDGDWPPNTVRRLIKELRQTSNAGGSKVALIYEGDRMNIHSANAFLKTLEEPPPNTHIFIITERPNDLLDTIRSRCINLKVECNPKFIQDINWKKWLEDYSLWQSNLATGLNKNFSPTSALLSAYSLLDRFDKILSKLSQLDLDEQSEENIEPEVLEAIQSGERRSLRKKLLSEIEVNLVKSTLGASKGFSVPSTKLRRALNSLEKSSALMDLNMQDTPALEFFMLSSLRIFLK